MRRKKVDGVRKVIVGRNMIVPGYDYNTKIQINTDI